MHPLPLIKPIRLLAAGLSALLLVGSALATQVPERYIDAQLQVVRSLEKHLNLLARVADESATRLVAGGSLYLAGEPGMVAEVFGRAGGPCGAKKLALDEALPSLGPQDVILLSDYGTAGALAAALDKLAPTEALVVVFASSENPLLRSSAPANLRFVPVDIPLDSRLLQLPTGEKFLPTAPPAITTAQWTYIAELLGACRRQNKQLAIYLSTFLDPGRARYNRTRGLLFEPDLQPAPVPREQYAREFLGHVRRSLVAIRSGELGNIRTAAAWLREATTARQQIVRSLMGHLPPLEAGKPGDVSFFTQTLLLTGEKGENWVRENARAGDLIMLLAYQNEEALTESANALGTRTIAITSAGPSPRQASNPRHLYINPYWPITDGCLDLPGYDVKACPLSTILNMTCYYAIGGEVLVPEKR